MLRKGQREQVLLVTLEGAAKFEALRVCTFAGPVVVEITGVGVAY